MKTRAWILSKQKLEDPTQIRLFLLKWEKRESSGNYWSVRTNHKDKFTIG